MDVANKESLYFLDNILYGIASGYNDTAGVLTGGGHNFCVAADLKYPSFLRDSRKASENSTL